MKSAKVTIFQTLTSWCRKEKNPASFFTSFIRDAKKREWYTCKVSSRVYSSQSLRRQPGSWRKERNRYILLLSPSISLLLLIHMKKWMWRTGSSFNERRWDDETVFVHLFFYASSSYASSSLFLSLSSRLWSSSSSCVVLFFRRLPVQSVGESCSHDYHLQGGILSTFYSSLFFLYFLWRKSKNYLIFYL